MKTDREKDDEEYVYHLFSQVLNNHAERTVLGEAREILKRDLELEDESDDKTDYKLAVGVISDAIGVREYMEQENVREIVMDKAQRIKELDEYRESVKQK